MKVLLVDSSYPINTRNTRIVNSLKKIYKQFQPHVCAWNRDKRVESNQEGICYHVYDKPAAYGNPFKKIIALFSYFFYVRSLNLRLQPSVLIASHWDMLVICSLIKTKKQKLVYENLDLPTASSTFARKLLDRLERFSLKKADLIIFASRFFEGRYSFFHGQKIILENLPLKSVQNSIKKYTYTSDRLKISFIGTVRYFEVMKNLIDSISGLDVEVLFWGDGPDLEKLKLYAEKNSCVKFFGKYEYDNIRDIYELSDLIWAVYPSQDYNVKYAISNKFYECFMYCRPGIFAKDTCLAELVEQDQIGFTVDPYNEYEIRNLLHKINVNPDLIETLKINLTRSVGRRHWEDNEELLKIEFDKLCKE